MKTEQKYYYFCPCSGGALFTRNVVHNSTGTCKPFNKSLNGYQQQQLKNGFKGRAAIEPRIGHLKEDHRLSRNYYKGIKGDNINVMLAAAAMNFKRMINIYKKMFSAFLFRLLKIFFTHLFPQNLYLLTAK